MKTRQMLPFPPPSWVEWFQTELPPIGKIEYNYMQTFISIHSCVHMSTVEVNYTVYAYSVHALSTVLSKLFEEWIDMKVCI